MLQSTQQYTKGTCNIPKDSCEGFLYTQKWKGTKNNTKRMNPNKSKSDIIGHSGRIFLQHDKNKNNIKPM